MKTLLLIFFLLPLLVFAQVSSYPFTYKPKLPDRPSFLYTLLDDSKTELTDTSTQLVTIKLIDEQAEPIYYTNFYIVKSNGDTVKLLSDDNGIATARLSFNNFQLVIRQPQYTYLNQFVPLNAENRTICITAVLGKSFRLVIPILKSKRALTEVEMIEIIQDVSKGNRTPRLIKNKVCYLNFEI